MFLGWVAIGIALLSALFTGVMAKLAFNEQKRRLRPYMYIGKTDTNITDKTLVFHIGMTNCGLSPARKVIISNEFHLNGDVIKKRESSATTKYVIVLPNQTIGKDIIFEEPDRSKILQGEVKLTAKIEIRYQGYGKCYYFISTFVFNLRNKKWTVVEADAD